MFEILLPLVTLVGLMAIGVPVAYSMLAAGVLGIVMVVDADYALGLLTLTPHAETTTLSYTVIPMFVLMAEFLGVSTVASGLYRTARAWTSRIPGGLASSTIAAGTAMGAVSGSSLATTSMLSRIAIPEMRAVGYDDRLSVSAAASGGVIAAMIPPSVIMLIYGITTETSISQLFAAGIIPGILQAVVFMTIIAVWVKMRPGVAPQGARVGWVEKFASLKHTGPGILLIVLVLGGIYAGAVTIIEAGAIGALGALVIGMVFGGLRWEGIQTAVSRTLATTASIFLVIIGAKIFAQFVALSGVTQSLTRAIAESGLPSMLILLAVLLVYLVLGMFMDSVGTMLLTLPIFFPLIISLGYDPIWFGVIVVLMIEIGLLTPPLGLNVFVATSVAKAEIRSAFSGAIWFVVGSLLTVAIIIAFPSLATFIPGLVQ